MTVLLGNRANSRLMYPKTKLLDYTYSTQSEITEPQLE